jgi:HlyD family secretion protein
VIRSLTKWTIILIVVGTTLGLAYTYGMAYWKKRSAPKFRTAKAARGDIVAVVNATGTVEPVQSVRVGSVVSGPVKKLYVDFNDSVNKGDPLADIDPRLYEAVKTGDEAALATAEADVKRVEAQLQQSSNDYDRARALREENADFISDTEIDRYKFECLALTSQLEVAKAAVLQAEARLKNSKTNLDYTNIVSPVTGVVIDRKVDEGQTVAASFQTPELFVVAPNLDQMHVLASVDEADIGLIREAERTGQPVYFSVDAYPNDLFEGKIVETRMTPTSQQNVVTYPVVVLADNPELEPVPGKTDDTPQYKLLPGMTADLSFHVQKQEGVLKVPNAALRFYPKPNFVRPEDRKLLEGDQQETDTDGAESSIDARSATQRVDDYRSRTRRHVWVIEDDLLRAVEVTTGLSDYKYTEIVSGELDEEQEVVTGVK